MRLVFGLKGEGERKLVDPAIFSPDPPHLYHPKLRKKHEGKTSHSYLDKIALSQNQRSTLCLLSFLSFYEFASCSHSLICLFLLFITAIIFYFVLTSFFLSKFWDVASFFFLFFTWFLFLINFNWASFFNKSIWVNLYKLTFSIPQLFHSQLNKKEEN